MDKKPNIWHESRGGSGPLWVYWYPGPYGNAVEDFTQHGIGFFAHNGELLAAQFDHVSSRSDHQCLELENKFFKHRVEVIVKKKKISVKLITRKKTHKKTA